MQVCEKRVDGVQEREGDILKQDTRARPGQLVGVLYQFILKCQVFLDVFI